MEDIIQRTIDRLKALDLDGKDSHESLSAICSALHSPVFGWTTGECEMLRELLVGWLEQFDPADWADEYLDEVGLTRMPKDADGEVIRIGDRVGTFGDMTNDGRGFVTAIVYYGGAMPGVHCHLMTPVEDYVVRDPRSIRHCKQPTVEDLLNDFAIACEDVGNAGPAVAVLAGEYAERIEGLMSVDQ